MNDLAATLRLHDRLRRLTQKKETAQIDRHDRVKIIGCHLSDGFAPVHAGAVDQDVQPPQRRMSLLDQPATTFHIG